MGLAAGATPPHAKPAVRGEDPEQPGTIAGTARIATTKPTVPAAATLPAVRAGRSRAARAGGRAGRAERRGQAPALAARGGSPLPRRLGHGTRPLQCVDSRSRRGLRPQADRWVGSRSAASVWPHRRAPTRGLQPAPGGCWVVLVAGLLMVGLCVLCVLCGSFSLLLQKQEQKQNNHREHREHRAEQKRAGRGERRCGSSGNDTCGARRAAEPVVAQPPRTRARWRPRCRTPW